LTIENSSRCAITKAKFCEQEIKKGALAPFLFFNNYRRAIIIYFLQLERQVARLAQIGLLELFARQAR
jgi:hypothetical protein